MGVVVLILTWGCAAGITTTASRMTWSFARDNGTPLSRYLKKVSKTQKIPIVAILVTTIFAALLVLIYVGSKVAFNDVISLTITGFYGSYFLPCAFLLYHRLKGHILPPGSTLPQRLEQSRSVSLTDGTRDAEAETQAAPDEGAEIQVVLSEKAETQVVLNENAEIRTAQDRVAESQAVRQEEDDTWSVSDEESQRQATPGIDDEFAGLRFGWGPWRVKGIFGTINNVYACVYMIYVIFWSVWPPATPVSANTMNYSIVVTGGVMILSGVWYVLWGYREFKGPIVEVEENLRAGVVAA
jgi:amino acid transporter